MDLLILSVLYLMVLLSVAFVTLLERKILGYIQFRKGPNKVGLMGIFQPFSDAVKLFTKEKVELIMSNFMLFYFIPIFSLMLMLMYWVMFPWMKEMTMTYDIIYFISISSLGVYIILISGWASNSKYSLIGSYRGVAQTISYEVSMSFLLLLILGMSMNYKIMLIIESQTYINNFFLILLVFFMWLVVFLAEVNRTPFDFCEGESELVSGFNVEFGSGLFAFLFMAEYGNIIFFSLLTSLLFFGGMGKIFLYMMLLVMFCLMIRGTLARFRYDKLMMISWKIILPTSIMLMYFIWMILMN